MLGKLGTQVRAMAVRLGIYQIRSWVLPRTLSYR
jgi:hypothetical protein